MSEPISEPEPTTETVLELEQIEELAADDEQALDMRAVRQLRSENKKLRHQLREAQENYGGAAARLAAAERREIERTASEVLVDPQDLWIHTDAETQQSFIDSEFHEISRDRIVETAKALIAERPHLARPNTSPPPSDGLVEGLRPGASREEKPKPATWFGAIRGG